MIHVLILIITALATWWTAASFALPFIVGVLIWFVYIFLAYVFGMFVGVGEIDF